MPPCGPEEKCWGRATSENPRFVKTEKKQESFYTGGWFQPISSEKCARRIGSFLQVEVKIKNLWNHHLVVVDLEKNWKIFLVELSLFGNYMNCAM